MVLCNLHVALFLGTDLGNQRTKKPALAEQKKKKKKETLFASHCLWNPLNRKAKRGMNPIAWVSGEVLILITLFPLCLSQCTQLMEIVAAPTSGFALAISGLFIVCCLL